VEEEEDDGGAEEEQRRGEEVNEPVHPMEGFEPVDRAANLQKCKKLILKRLGRYSYFEKRF
jgi:hypothetical protein